MDQDGGNIGQGEQVMTDFTPLFTGFCVFITMILAFITAGSILSLVFMGLAIIEVCLYATVSGDNTVE